MTRNAIVYMPSNYAKRASERLQEDGIEVLFKTSTRFLVRKVVSDNILFGIYTVKNKYVNRLKYDCPANPYQPIEISPRRGERLTRAISKAKGLGQITDGDWEQCENTKPLSERYEYQGLIQRFDEGRNWEETIYYKEAKREIAKKGSVAGYTDIEEFLNIRCAYVDDLFGEIREEGYRPNFRGIHDVPNGKRAGKKRYLNELEPLISIGRNGGIFWVEGLHRLAISRILGIEKIPVQVIVRHKQWQKLRDKIYNNGLPEARENLRDHPDLQDVLKDDDS